MSGLAVKTISNLITPVTDVDTQISTILGGECSYLEYALADTVDTDNYKNDTSSFLFRKIDNSDTITVQLWKNGAKVSDVTDNTYGTYYPNFPTQLLYVGFVVDWRKVLIAQGSGCYQIKADKTLLGENSTFESRKFQLLPYSEFNSRNTVRIETYQTGNIVKSEFDYTNLIAGGWKQSFRINGFFGLRSDVLEVENYFDSNYNIEQIKTKNTPEYILETKILPSVISNLLVNDNILANRFIINDYNVNNSNLYRDFECMPVSFEDVVHANSKQGTIYRIKFVDKVDGLRKRNY
jgi:hypothetical protein